MGASVAYNPHAPVAPLDDGPHVFIVGRRALPSEYPLWMRPVMHFERLLVRVMQWGDHGEDRYASAGPYQIMGVYATEDEALMAAASIPGGFPLQSPMGRMMPVKECRYGLHLLPNSHPKSNVPVVTPDLQAVNMRLFNKQLSDLSCAIKEFRGTHS